MKLDYTRIIDNNKDLINDVIKYMSKLLKVEYRVIRTNTRLYVRDMLYQLKRINYEINAKRNQRDRLQEDLFYLERHCCKGASSGGIGEGHNNGGKPNGELNRQIQILQMYEDLEHMTIDIMLAEKTRDEKNKLVRDFIYLVPQIQYARILEATYFDGIRDDSIASEVNYDYDAIRVLRNKAINELADIIRIALDNII